MLDQIIAEQHRDKRQKVEIQVFEAKQSLILLTIDASIVLDATARISSPIFSVCVCVCEQFLSVSDVLMIQR